MVAFLKKPQGSKDFLIASHIRKKGIKIPQSNVSSSAADKAITKEMHDGLGRVTTTASSLAIEPRSGDSPIQARPERLSNLPYEPPLKEGNTSQSGECSMQYLELMKICTKLLEKVTSLETELTSTKPVYNKALISLTKRVKALETQLKHKGRRPVIDSLDEAEPSLDAKDSPKQERIIEELNKDKNTVDDETLAETLLNIKRSAAKNKRKGIMQEPDLPKKIKEKERIQLSFDEELAQKLYAKYLAKETARQEQEKFDLQQQSSKKQKLDEQAKVQVDSDQEEYEMKKYMKIVPGEEIEIDAIPLATKPPVIVD
nr:hypothetical protein [Tanacetum cinerariifolium]